jgi:microcystin-dependent protein
MPSVLLSPVGNGQQFFDNNGIPNAGGLIYTYQAGSSTLLTTYTTVNGTIANTNPIVLDAYGRTPSEIWMQVGYSYKFIIQTASAVTLQTLDDLYPILQSAPAVSSAFVAGMIIIWSGSLGSVPVGWVLCDGTNATPDLRDRFIVGAGNTYAVGATGGSANAIVVTHTHTVTDPGHNHLSGSNGGDTSATWNPFGYDAGQRWDGAGALAGAIGSSHNSNTKTTGITLVNAGTSGTNANLPPYYALAYIMKT